MTGTARHIDDQADVLNDPAVHFAHRPQWTCDADGQDWPCEPLRAHLLATMSTQDIGVSMGAYYPDAVREIDVPATEVHDRLFGWIHG